MAVECFNGVCRRRRPWLNWGIWTFLGLLVVVFLTVFFLFACIARRRRRRGAQPMYGTGWMAPPNKYGGPEAGYHPQQQQPPPQGYGQAGFAPPPPAYGQPQAQYPQSTGTNFHPNDGYYGDGSQQQHGVQPPATAYQPHNGPYSPPPGPPPGK
ncbi:Protein RCR2 [Ophiocordyceps camponoti-floridani]|uniref:Protein RCR2 n=1 Tax=Ophiocordyceps camponoti-floridani TaxID=2030778 RepID=A0A8H4VG16_9HYPO|nr:Protein RCR2 [Ophiocordyceps camponoti-floridani]